MVDEEHLTWYRISLVRLQYGSLCRILDRICNCWQNSNVSSPNQFHFRPKSVRHLEIKCKRFLTLCYVSRTFYVFSHVFMRCLNSWLNSSGNSFNFAFVRKGKIFISPNPFELQKCILQFWNLQKNLWSFCFIKFFVRTIEKFD